MDPSVPPLVQVRDLRVAFGAGAPVLHGVDLDVAPGECLGLVGESGCGKSVTWLAVLGLLPARARVSGSAVLHRPDGPVELVGAAPRVLERVRGGRIALISQDPGSALNPVLRLGRQVEEALGRHRGLRGAAARAEARRLFEQVGLPDPARRLDAYAHEMSGGQNQRVLIAMALAGRPALLVADEPTTALDVTIQAQILDLLARLRRELGMAVVLISHDLGVVGEVCERVAVLYAGRVVEQAPAAALFAGPAHPYARGLLGALPPMTGPRRRLPAIPGVVPAPGALPAGCAFRPRCDLAVPACAAAVPPLRALPARGAHLAACLRAGESRGAQPVARVPA